MRDRDHDNLDERSRRELTALADGSLSGRRRTAVEARVERSPELRLALERQQLAVTALGTIEPPAPAALRARLTGSAAPAPKRTAPWLGWAAGAVAAVAAAIVVVVIVAGGPGAPTIDDADGLAVLAPTEPAPSPQTGDPALLTASAQGLAFPNWAREFGWRAAGARTGELGDRTATTVYYEKDGQTIGYSIVSGEPLAPPPGGESTTLDGVEFTVARDGGQTTVTWLRDGHSCVLSGSGVDARTLVELAAWKGDGAVAF